MIDCGNLPYGLHNLLEVGRFLSTNFFPLGDPKKKRGLQLVQLTRFWKINDPKLPYYVKERKS